MSTDLLKRLSKNGSVVSESDFFDSSKIDFINTGVPALNIALSGSADGGLTPGFTVIAGPSRTFKSCMSLIMVASYLKKYPDAVCIFYDTEFGITDDYMKAQGVDTSRVIHIPCEDLETLKFDITQKLDEISKGDKVIVLIDSLGNIASKKEVEDALNEKSVADMSRAKAMKSLLRIIATKLVIKGLPCIGICHVYAEMGLFPKTVISGGTGIMYNSNTAIIISKSQDKQGTELKGFTFTLNMEKSRFVKEKSKIGLTVGFDDGIYKYSGLLPIALESGHIVKPKNGWYAKANPETGEILSDSNVREKDTGEIIEDLLKDETFNRFIEQKYKLAAKQMVTDGYIETKEQQASDED